jgi:branched-subunit amino acid ABC-type transport system permease component
LVLIQVFVSGLSLAGYYALLAVGFALIFATFRIFHIAQAAVFGAAGYSMYFLNQQGFGLIVSAATGIAVAAVFGWLVDRLIYRPLAQRGAGLFSMFIASLGVALMFEAAMLIYTRGNLVVAHAGSLPIMILGDVVVRQLDLVVVGLVITLYGCLHLWLTRTRQGLAVLGLSDNPELAGIVGVNTKRTRAFVFLLASALAGVAGAFTAYDTGLVPTTGIDFLFITFVAVILGGTRNVLLGSALGSVVLGLTTSFASFFAPAWVTVIVFALLIVLLIGRPKGLLA